MRLGRPIDKSKYKDPASWVIAIKEAGYRAAYCPVGLDADDVTIREYAQAAKTADIIIAEIGAWSNPLSPDEEERRAALHKCKSTLALADKIGALCCVNIAGSRDAEQWDAPHPDNLTDETFEMIVMMVRDIVDDVQPLRSVYTLETMPWMYPDSADSYLRLLQAIDRPSVAAHFDPVNLICSPQRYFNNGALIRDCFAKLGPYIKSCHAKDILLQPKLTTHLDEVRPGLGNLDYAIFLQEAHKISPDMPVMLEHLPSSEEYDLAAAYVRQVAEEEGIPL